VNEKPGQDANEDPDGDPARPTIRASDGNVRTGGTVAGPLVLSLEGERVERCCIDHALTLIFDGSEPWTLRLEGPFVLVSPAPSPGPVDFGGNAPPSAYAPALDILLHNSVTAANLMAVGTLELMFADSYRLVVPPSAQWEAWQLNGPRGELVVSGPGGQVSRWPAQA